MTSSDPGDAVEGDGGGDVRGAGADRAGANSCSGHGHTSRVAAGVGDGGAAQVGTATVAERAAHPQVRGAVEGEVGVARIDGDRFQRGTWIRMRGRRQDERSEGYSSDQS